MIRTYKGSPKEQKRKRRQKGIRSSLSGTADRPRICVFRSLTHIYAQAIDDTRGHTIASVADKMVDSTGTKSEIALRAGEYLGKQLQEKNITQVVFDRAGYRYHGRVKALADGLRSSGILF